MKCQHDTTATTLIQSIKVEDDGLPNCPHCGKGLKDDWHGLAACFCKWGGREPTIDEIVQAVDEEERRQNDPA